MDFSDVHLILSNWGWVTHIYVNNLGHNWFRYWLVTWSTPSHCLDQHWYIVNWTLGNNFSQILMEIQTFSFKKTHLKILSAKWRPSCLSFNVLNYLGYHIECWPMCSTIRSKQHGCYTADNTFKYTFSWKKFVFWFMRKKILILIHRNLFLWV